MNKCKIVADDRGKHMIVMPDGQKVPALVWTRVWDGLPDQASYVIAKILIDIQPNEEPKKHES